MGSGTTPQKLALFSAACLAVACTHVNSIVPIDVTGFDPVVVRAYYGSPKGPFACPTPAEWDLVTWPEMDAVAATELAGEADGSACALSLRPDARLTARWYAARWRGDAGLFGPSAGAIELHDGSWLWRFRGALLATVTRIETIPRMGRLFVHALVSRAIDPAPGHDWRSLMTVTQGEVACTYPALDFSGDTLIVECTGIDLNAPVHIHIDGAVTREGPRAPMPLIDLDHTFGPSTISFFELTDAPPACTDPRCE